MKRLLCVILSAAMLSGLAACGESPAASQTENMAEPQQTYSVYVPNDNADGFAAKTVSTEEISAETVLTGLKEQKVLPDEVSITSFGVDGGAITMDFNQAFADAVCSMGTSGELMMIGSVVNTFLDAFQAESVYFTVGGQIFESGHETYDFPMTVISVDPQPAE